MDENAKQGNVVVKKIKTFDLSDMMITTGTYDKMIELLTLSFEYNAFTDNCAYNIDAVRFALMSNIYHHSFAHHFPAIADTISDTLIDFNARPVRKAIGGYEKKYESLIELFKENREMTQRYRDKIIEVAEFNRDKEIQLVMENFLTNFIPFYKQADVWYNQAIYYSDTPERFNVHFEELTTYIPVIKE